MNKELTFVTIERLEEIKSEYTMKACEENGKSEETNRILWYASRAIVVYNRFGNTTKIEKDIKEFRSIVAEMMLNF